MLRHSIWSEITYNLFTLGADDSKYFIFKFESYTFFLSNINNIDIINISMQLAALATEASVQRCYFESVCNWHTNKLSMKFNLFIILCSNQLNGLVKPERWWWYPILMKWDRLKSQWLACTIYLLQTLTGGLDMCVCRFKY